jgi:hypothetical protein
VPVSRKRPLSDARISGMIAAGVLVLLALFVIVLVVTAG